MIEEVRQGLEHFQRRTYHEYETLYHELENVQHPHTLFIACSDSRVSPEKIVNAKPGDLFTVRNIANTVPSYDDPSQNLTTLSAIEFAVEVLQVREIIICGHSNCGGCAAALAGPETMSQLPYTRDYLQPLESVKKVVEAKSSRADSASRARMMEQENVRVQLEHLQQYPFISERVKSGALQVEGWHYDIGEGKVAVYSEKDGCFQAPELIETERKA